jgi:hypothetical protein
VLPPGSCTRESGTHVLHACRPAASWSSKRPIFDFLYLVRHGAIAKAYYDWASFGHLYAEVASSPDHAERGVGVAPNADTQLLAQDGVYVLPRAIQTPQPEVVISGLPGQEVMRQ